MHTKHLHKERSPQNAQNMFSGKAQIISLKNAQSKKYTQPEKDSRRPQLTTCTLPLGAALTAAAAPSPTTLSFSPVSPNTRLNSLQALR